MSVTVLIDFPTGGQNNKTCSNILLLKGRIPYYDQYGAIRDMLQNHVTEIMTLLTMRLPKNQSSSEEVLQNKLQILSSLRPLGKNQAVVGQYQTYNSEVQQELNKTADYLSLTPTFAGEHQQNCFLISLLPPFICTVWTISVRVLQPCWRTWTRPATKACPYF